MELVESFRRNASFVFVMLAVAIMALALVLGVISLFVKM